MNLSDISVILSEDDVLYGRAGKTAVNEPGQETFTKDAPSLDELEQETI